MSDRYLIFAYEPEQVMDIAEFLKGKEGDVVALDYWTERELIAHGIDHLSVAQYLPSAQASDELFSRAQSLAHQWYRIPAMSFFEYQGIPLAEALEPNVDDYLQYVLYMAFLIGRALNDIHGVTRLAVPCTRKTVGPTSAPLLSFQFESPRRLVAELARSRSLPFEVIGELRELEPVPAIPPVPLMQRVVLAAYNRTLSLLPRKRISLYGSESWPHIATFLARMSDTELILTDKGEFRQVPWRERIRLRVRFVLPGAGVSRQGKIDAHAKSEAFRNEWLHAKCAVAANSGMSQDGYSLWPILEPAFDYLVNRFAERVIVDIVGIESTMRTEGIDRVLLRASVSSQHHFFVMARIARLLGIPSIEIQHAGAVLDPRSVHSRLEASYLAAFGPLICAEYAKRYDPRRLRAIGAPRFDPYFSRPAPGASERDRQLRGMGLDPARPVVLVVVPKEGPPLTLAPWHLTSYDVGAFFDTLAAAHNAVPEAQFIFKFRRKGCWPQHRSFLRKYFAGVHAISEDDLFSMITISDCVISGNSTALYETIIADKPLILFPWKPDNVHNRIYERIAPIVWTVGQLEAELIGVLKDHGFRRQRLSSERRFLRENYLFDGRAGERMAAFLRAKLTSFPGSSR